MEQLLAIDNADSVLFHSSEISEKYKKMSKAHRMNLEKIDFTNLPEAIRVINEWITKHTNGQMFNVIRELDARINMALFSVFMRQITWVRSFNPTLTKKKPFYAGGKSMEVEMMKRYYIYNVTEAKFANFAFIPINHNHQQAVIILPNEGFTLDDVFKHFKFIDLPIYYQKSSVSYLKLKIPKFTLLGSKDMVRTLKHFNVSLIFESNNKDFKDFAGENGFLKTFLQVVNVEVKEARTIYFSNTDDDAVMGGWKTDFICDRPFYFLIYDHNARIVLLAASIKNPNAA
ncbi:Glia-derived nexin [Thelohanellus kitauei]|uniref:Glia-derived nexin n=1 Tax=Thelohanellus kitauei TaxID=669202 RepID=A0A0C2MYB8_THEKT|nr:Glia-derived nexin [Thelohanellus kitauei]